MRQTMQRTLVGLATAMTLAVLDAGAAMAQLVQSEVESESGPVETTQLVTSSTEVRRAVIGLVAIAVVAAVLGILYWMKTGEAARDRHERRYGGKHGVGAPAPARRVAAPSQHAPASPYERQPPQRAHQPQVAQQAYQPEPTYHPQQAFQPEPSYQRQQAYQPEPTHQRQQAFQPEPTYRPQQAYQPEPTYQPPQAYQPQVAQQPRPRGRSEHTQPGRAEATHVHRVGGVAQHPVSDNGS